MYTLARQPRARVATRDFASQRRHEINGIASLRQLCRSRTVRPKPHPLRRLPTRVKMQVGCRTENTTYQSCWVGAAVIVGYRGR